MPYKNKADRRFKDRKAYKMANIKKICDPILDKASIELATSPPSVNKKLRLERIPEFKKFTESSTQTDILQAVTYFQSEIEGEVAVVRPSFSKEISLYIAENTRVNDVYIDCDSKRDSIENLNIILDEQQKTLAEQNIAIRDLAEKILITEASITVVKGFCSCVPAQKRSKRTIAAGIFKDILLEKITSTSTSRLLRSNTCTPRSSGAGAEVTRSPARAAILHENEVSTGFDYGDSSGLASPNDED